MRLPRLLLPLGLAASAVFAVGPTAVGGAGPLVQEASITPPTRILDTRSGTGAPSGRLVPGQTLVLAVPDAAGAGASSVMLNFTSTQAVAPGWVKVWPCGDPMPATSALNFVPGRDSANAVVSKLPAGGLCITSDVAVHLIADIAGWYTGAADFTGSTPNRLLDTRVSGNPLTTFTERRLKVAGTPGISATATIAALNLTVDRTRADGYISAYPCGQQTNASTVNFSAGETVANLTFVALGAGDVCITSSVGTDLIVDSYGYSTGAGRLQVQNPDRVLDTRNPALWPSGQAQSQSTIQLRVAGRGGVPNDAEAALITVTVANPESDGYVTVWPCDETMPIASTVNTWPNALRSNIAAVELSDTDGTACLKYFANNGTPTDLIVDAVGWITGGPARSAPTGPGTVLPAPGGGSGGGGSSGGGGGGTGSTSSTAFVPASQPNQFFEDFKTANGFYGRFQTQVFHGTGQVPTDLPMWHGDHDGACQGPTTLRDVHVNNPSELFWFCAPKGPDSGHMMTSMYTTGYAQVDFAPNQSFTNINRVCWDQNQTEMGGRKWTQMVVVPENIYAANGNRLNYVKPELQADVAVNGVHLSGSTFLYEMLRGSTSTFVGQSTNDHDYAGFTTPDKARRFKTCVTDLNNGTVRIELERESGIDVRVLQGSFPDGPVRVIFQDDNYNPPKDERSTDSLTTWHWDNIDIS
jgi:hypothetical protein